MERQSRNQNRITWTVGDDHTGEIEQPPAGLGVGSVQISGDFSGATVFLQISNDGSTWFTLRDIAGSNVSASTDSFFEISTGAAYFRAMSTGGDGDTDVSVIVTAWSS